ncbi:MAG TPA: YXWGXW repeat-containing protein [Pirellulales bacterium]|nr:YXWGXW repeat-containing protein [Pirellulales bacterium]
MGCTVVIGSLAATGPVCSAADKEARRGSRHAAEPLRGPIHEAFLQPSEGADLPGATVATAPSAPLRDYPAAIRPSAKTATWIPGYWGWDETANKFAWVTGVWRVPPPGMRWVPGYWSRAGDDWRWVRGFWLPRDEPRLAYLPPPPPPQDEPELGQLDDDQFAVPGYWSYSAGRHAWNRGFKARRKRGWVWTPTHHAWTPAGSLLLPGYWDYELGRRGLLFAPLPAFATAQAQPASAASLAPKAAVNLASLPDLAVAGASHGHHYYDPAKSDAAELTIPISALGRSPRAAPSANEMAAESLPRVAQNGESVRLLSVQRAKFESGAAGDRTDGRLTFYLPPPAEPVNFRPAQISPGEAASEYVPGTSGRRVPGAGGRSVPGISGRMVPGVDTSLPGVVGPNRNE